MPLALAEVDSHLISPQGGVLHLGKQEDLCLGLFDDLHESIVLDLIFFLKYFILF